MAIRFPMTLSAVQAAERNQCEALFRIGDALLEECGEPSLIKTCAAELEAHGFPNYSESYLGQLHYTAQIYPPFSRVYNLGFTVHREAGNPEVLRSIVANAPKGQAITRRYVGAIVDRLREEETLRERERARCDRDAATARKESATSGPERRRAEQDEQEAHQRFIARSPIKKSEMRPPAPRQPGIFDDLLTSARLHGQLDEASARLRGFISALDDTRDLSPTAIASLFERCMEVVDLAREAAAAVRARTGKGAHLVAIDREEGRR